MSDKFVDCESVEWTPINNPVAIAGLECPDDELGTFEIGIERGSAFDCGHDVMFIGTNDVTMFGMGA